MSVTRYAHALDSQSNYKEIAIDRMDVHLFDLTDILETGKLVNW